MFLSHTASKIRLCQPIGKGVPMNCPHCRELEQAYEAALSEYVEARASAWFRICPKLAARKNVDMERTKYELEEHSLEEHSLVCVSAGKSVAPLPERDMSTALKQLVTW
jgi:hypothetical protein